MDFYSKYFFPFPRLRTTDLVLRKIRIGDVEDLYEYCKRPESCRYSNWTVHTSPKDTRDYVYWMQGRYIKKQGYTFAVEYAGRVIGTASFMEFDEHYGTVEIGYGINSDYWHKGFGTQIVSALLHYAFKKMNMQRVWAKVMPENERSAGLLKKCGFTYEGRARKSEYIKGKYIDIDTYAILKDEYFALKGEK